MEHFYKTIGEDWFTYESIYNEMIYRFKDGSHFVEVGSWKGRSSSYMGVEIINSRYNIKFDCVDTWNGTIEHRDSQGKLERRNNDRFLLTTLWDEFNNNISPIKHIINPIRMSSVNASKLYDDNSLDFVFLDGSHVYNDIVMDILNWLPKVKVGGVLAGHDYKTEENDCCMDVNKAVHDTLKGDIIVRDQSWVYEKIIPHESKSLY